MLQTLSNLFFEFFRVFAIVFIIHGTHFCGNGETSRYWQAYAVHFSQVSAFSAEKVFHVGSAFSLTSPESINVFGHRCLQKKLKISGIATLFRVRIAQGNDRCKRLEGRAKINFRPEVFQFR